MEGRNGAVLRIMTDDIPPSKADRTQLQQIIAGLNDGVILIDTDQTIAWANAMALTLHGVTEVAELGATVSEYRERFRLTYRNRHKLPKGDYPMERLLAGEAFSEVVVEVRWGRRRPPPLDPLHPDPRADRRGRKAGLSRPHRQ